MHIHTGFNQEKCDLKYVISRLTTVCNSKIPKGQTTKIVKSEDRKDHGQQKETKDKTKLK